MEASKSCDGENIIYVCIDGEKIECQRSVLAEKSDYFQAMFQSQMKESKSDEIVLKGVSPDTFKELLELMVTRELDFHKDNIQNLTEAACMFQVSSAIQQCKSYLIDSMNHDNCISTLFLAETFSLCEVYNYARRHVLWYFTDAYKTQEFLQLDKNHLIELLSEKMLNVDSELVIYHAIENWILYDLADRQCYLEDVLQHCFHAEDLHDEEIDILQSQLQQNFPDYWQNAMKIIYTSRSSNGPRHKKFRQILQTIISIGGEFPGEDRSIPFQQMHQFDLESCVFESDIFADLSDIHSSPGTDIGYAVCVKGKDIIFTGGEIKLGRNTWITDVWKYDTLSSQWDVLTQLPSVRRHHGMCVMGDNIYLIGGFGKFRVKLNHVESFNCKTGEWNTLSPLPEPCFSMATTVCNGKIYAFKSRVFCYDPEKDQWKTDHGDPPPFISSDALTYGNYIYLPSRYCNRLMRYNTVSKVFEDWIKQFPHSKAGGSSVICEDKIYHVGISDLKTYMEWYNLKEDKFGSSEELNLTLLENKLISVPYFKDVL